MKAARNSEKDPISEEELKRPCRFCRTPLEHTFIDLGVSPLSNSYLKTADLARMEPFYPLHVYVCKNCLLVQLEELSRPEDIFTEYAYFSSFSESWLEHARRFAHQAVKRFNLSEQSLVVEIGSNDGYLLKYFKEQGVLVLGIEPALNVARVAKEKGLETRVSFFSAAVAEELSLEGKKADLVVGNNVLAHIPDTRDLMRGLKTLLKPGGVVSMEFPHLLSLMEQNQYDTIYHEHYSYFSLTAADQIFSAYDLCIYDLEELTTHGGSLRIYACLAGNESFKRTTRVEDFLKREEDQGLKELRTYLNFGERVKKSKLDILKFLIRAKEAGLEVCGYGAPAKGNTLLNYCGIGPELIAYTVDLNPYKEGCYLPGSRIPIYSPEHIFKTRPDYILILPWNLKTEIIDQMAGVREWGAKFVTLIPEIKVT